MTRRPSGRVAAWAAIAAAVAVSPVGAQDRTFADLAALLRDGDRVGLVVDGVRLDGRVTRVAPDTLVVTRGPAGEAYTVPIARLQQLSYDDGVANGGLVGAAVGALPGIWGGVLIRRVCEGDGGSCDAAPLLIGGVTAAVGLAIGLGLDYALRTTVRIAPARTSAAVAVVPDPRRPSATVSIRF